MREEGWEEGWELPDENVFRDDGYSGTTLKRPALDALRDKVRMRELEIVVMLSPDRLARNYVHQMVLIEEFEKNGCKVEFVERPMSSEPNDQLLLQIRGAVAEYERTLLSERMRRGRRPSIRPGFCCRGRTSPTACGSTPTGPATGGGEDGRGQGRGGGGDLRHVPRRRREPTHELNEGEAMQGQGDLLAVTHELHRVGDGADVSSRFAFRTHVG